MYWLPPSAVKQSGNTTMHGGMRRSCTRRAARSGTFSLKLFHATCDSPEPVNPTMSTSTGKRRPRPWPAPSSYCGGSHAASWRTCGSRRGLSRRILESCSSTTTVPDFHWGRFRAIGSPRCVRGERPKGKGAEAPFLSDVGPAVQAATRRLYSWVRVSISMRSPVAQNAGTCTSKPVASLAGLSTLPDVSPRTAGSV